MSSSKKGHSYTIENDVGYSTVINSVEATRAKVLGLSGHNLTWNRRPIDSGSTCIAEVGIAPGYNAR